MPDTLPDAPPLHYLMTMVGSRQLQLLAEKLRQHHSAYNLILLGLYLTVVRLYLK